MYTWVNSNWTSRFLSKPIEAGLPSDATHEEKLASLQLQLRLKNKLEPHVHRKGASILWKELPPIHDILLYLHPSQIQNRLIKLDENARLSEEKSTNFFR